MSNGDIKRLAVVLFAYDEKWNLLHLLRRIHTTLRYDQKGISIQYAICVQGTDGTVQDVEQFKGDIGDEAEVSMFHSVEPLGVRGAAVKAFEQVKGDVDAYLMMDCDLNHQPEELSSFFDKADVNTIVVGSRFVEGGNIIGMPHWKRSLSVIFNSLTSLMFRVAVRDKTSGYRLIIYPKAREIVREVEANGFDFYIEFLMRLGATGLKVVEVPICFLVRTHGESKMNIVRTTMNYLKLMRRIRDVTAKFRSGAAETIENKESA